MDVLCKICVCANNVITCEKHTCALVNKGFPNIPINLPSTTIEPLKDTDNDESLEAATLTLLCLMCAAVVFFKLYKVLQQLKSRNRR